MGVRLLIPVTHWGFPCCVRFPCVHAAATTPVQRLGVLDAHLTQPCQPSPEGSPGRPAHRPFRGLLGVHSRCGLHTRAVTVFRDPLSEGFRHFVTSMPAPVASGWSGRRVGLAPTGKRRLFTAHTPSGRSRQISTARSKRLSCPCGIIGQPAYSQYHQSHECVKAKCRAAAGKNGQKRDENQCWPNNSFDPAVNPERKPRTPAQREVRCQR